MDTKAAEKQLRDMLAEGERRLKDIEQRLRGSHSASFSEQAVERESDEVDERLEETVTREIALIKFALDRISSGEYQTCSSCGGEINEARLEVLPYTTICINCAEKGSAPV
ncbi:MAG: TraR/DksA C4-type zinc finger protein [Sneathiella sp.]